MKFIEICAGIPEWAGALQHDIIPVNSIKNVYVVQSEKTSLCFIYNIGKREFKKYEYYENELQCLGRYAQIKQLLKIDNSPYWNPLPLPEEDDERNQYGKQIKNEKELKT